MRGRSAPRYAWNERSRCTGLMLVCDRWGMWAAGLVGLWRFRITQDSMRGLGDVDSRCAVDSGLIPGPKEAQPSQHRGLLWHGEHWRDHVHFPGIHARRFLEPCLKLRAANPYRLLNPGFRGTGTLRKCSGPDLLRFNGTEPTTAAS